MRSGTGPVAMKLSREPGQGRLVRRHRRHAHGFRFAGHESFFDEDWEARERAIVRDRLARADVLIDVGACHGIYSCLAASMGVGVAAIEPEPANLRFLMSNVRENGFGNVEVFPLALSDSVGVRALYGRRDTASLTPGWFGAARPSPRLVPTNTLDNLFAARWRDARVFVKADVEGEELALLRGASAFLGREDGPDWLIETFPFRQDRYPEPNPDFAELFRLMSAHGYRALHVDTGRDVTPRMAAEWAARPEAVDPGSSNYLFHAAGRAATGRRRDLP